MNTIILVCPSCSTKNRVSAGKQHLLPKCGKCGTKLTVKPTAVPVELTDHEFKSFISNASLPVMVDFYSPTCGPCTSLAPIIATLSREYLGKIIIAKLDTSNNPGTAMHYQIRGVPSLYFFKNGAVTDHIVGAPPEAQLRQKLNSMISL